MNATLVVYNANTSINNRISILIIQLLYSSITITICNSHNMAFDNEFST